MPISIFATALPDSSGFQDTVNINIAFKTVDRVHLLFCKRPEVIVQEYIEIYRQDTAITEGFQRAPDLWFGKPYTRTSSARTKARRRW